MPGERIFLDGEKIKRRRLTLKMSQSDLARGVTTQATISQMENANRVPNIGTLLEILSRLNLDLDVIRLKNSNEKEIQSLFIRVLSNEDGNDSESYQLEKLRQKYNHITGIYKYIVDALDCFYSKNSDYLKAWQNLELVITDDQFRSMSKIIKYFVYQYLALSKYRLGFVKVAKNYFNQMITYEPNMEIIDDEKFRCILQVRSNYIDFLISNNDYQFSEYYIRDSIFLCKQRFTIYLVPNLYRQLALIQKQKKENDLFLKYTYRADNIDTFLIS